MHLRRMNKARKHLTAHLVPSPNVMGEDSETASGCPRDAPNFSHYLSVIPVKLSQEEGDKGHFPVLFTNIRQRPEIQDTIQELCDPGVRGPQSSWEAGRNVTRGSAYCRDTWVPSFFF